MPHTNANLAELRTILKNRNINANPLTSAEKKAVKRLVNVMANSTLNNSNANLYNKALNVTTNTVPVSTRAAKAALREGFGLSHFPATR